MMAEDIPATSAPTVKTTEPAPCHLLELPAELRNNIYELAFIFESTDPIDLRTAKPPTPELVFTCRQIHDEAAALCVIATEAYWTNNKFVIEDVGGEEAPKLADRVATLAGNNLNKIARLTVRSYHTEAASVVDFTDGVWNYQDLQFTSSNPLYFVATTREDYGEGRIRDRPWQHQRWHPQKEVEFLCLQGLSSQPARQSIETARRDTVDKDPGQLSKEEIEEAIRYFTPARNTRATWF